MTKEQLIELSEDTFTSNNAKQVTAVKHRYFNENLIEMMVTGAKLGGEELTVEKGVIQIPGFPVNEFTVCEFENLHAGMYWKIDSNSIVLNGTVECSGENPVLSITNIPDVYLNRIKKTFPILAGVEINGIYSPRIVHVYAGNNRLYISPGYINASSHIILNLTYVQILFDEEESPLSWTTGQIVDISYFTSIAYGNGKFVTVGGSGSHAISIDGINWTSGNAGTADLNAITYGNGRFVAVGYLAYATSTDGITWTTGNLGSSFFDSIAYGNGRFVTVGDAGIYATCTNGTNWLTGNTGISSIYHIAYGNGRFVAVGNYGNYTTSTNGTTWEKGNAGTENINSIAYGNGRFVLVGQSGSCYTSTDGTSWTKADAGISTQLISVVYGNGKFVTVGNSGNYAISTDGIHWVNGKAGTSELRYLAYANGRFVAMGLSGEYAISIDGINWTTGNIDTSSPAIVYGNGRFVTVGNYGHYAALKI